MHEEDDAPLADVIDPPEGGESTSLAVRETRLPAVLDAETLIAVVQMLQKRIPDFHCLSVAEQRKMVRASNLDPEMIESGLMAAAISESAQRWAGMTVEELRRLDDEIRDADHVEQVLTVLLRGVAGANRKRKYRRGKAILRIYKYLGVMTPGDATGEETQLRPYYERMKAAYMKNRKG